METSTSGLAGVKQGSSPAITTSSPSSTKAGGKSGLGGPGDTRDSSDRLSARPGPTARQGFPMCFKSWWLRVISSCDSTLPPDVIGDDVPRWPTLLSALIRRRARLDEWDPADEGRTTRPAARASTCLFASDSMLAALSDRPSASPSCLCATLLAARPDAELAALLGTASDAVGCRCSSTEEVERCGPASDD